MSSKPTLPQNKIAEFCRKYHIRKLSLFGSVLRDDFRDDSDVDVLIEFEPGCSTDFFTLYEMQEELSNMLGGRQVDLVTARFLNRRIQERVLAEAEVQYLATSVYHHN